MFESALCGRVESARTACDCLLLAVTSDYHMLRAHMVAHIVLGSSGISHSCTPVPSRMQKEGILRVIRDVARAVLWVVSGLDGSGLTLLVHPTRTPPPECKSKAN